MKLLLVTATALAVFTVDCRDFSNEPEGRGTDNKVQLFPEDIEGQGKGQNLAVGPDGNNLAENQDSDYDDQQMKEEKKEHLQSTLRRSKCKSRNACVVMGGFCVINATLCSGRLVPEGCKGTNCQCCVPGTLEAKMDQLENTMNSILSNISSILQTQCKNKFTTSPTPSTTTAPVTTVPVTTSPIADTTAAPTTTTPVTTSPTPTTTVAPTTTPPVTTPPIPPTTTTTPTAVCSEAQGLIKVGNRCYKLFTDFGRSWQASKSKCQDEGLVLAKTDDPVAVRKLLVETYGNKYVWLGGRGTGSSKSTGHVEWDRDGTTLSSSNSAWYPGHPSSNTDTTHCLLLASYESNMRSYPTKPYWMNSCSWTTAYPLCEVVM